MSKEELVEQIKQLQRSDPSSKQMWWDYCHQHLGGVKDPNQHDAAVLSEFIGAYSGGSLPAGRAKGRGDGKGAWGGGSGGQGGWDMGSMMAAMAKAMSGNGGGASSPMADFIKTGQRASPKWKAVWQTYCTANGNDKFDPNRYDDAFIVGFIDYLSNLAELDGGASITAGAGGAKRSAAGWGGGPMGKRPNMGQIDSAKMECVNKVKQLQRSDPAGKEAWWNFADTQLAGVRDPSRHDASTLQQFLDTYSS